MRDARLGVTMQVLARPREEEDDDTRFDARWALVLAAGAIVLVKLLVPFGEQILYPFTLMATWVHEMGHGLTAIAVGGSFESLDVFWNASGLAHSRRADGWPAGLVAMGGLLAPPLVGALMLAFARGPRRATIVLYVLAAAMLVSVPVWVRSFTGWLVLPLLAAGLFALAYEGSDALKHVGAQGLGLLLGIDTVTRIDYLFTAEAFVDGEARASDIAKVGEHLGGPWIVWGVALAAVSLVLVAVGLRVAWMEELKLPTWKAKPKPGRRA